jgi:hypothetical protein
MKDPIFAPDDYCVGIYGLPGTGKTTTLAAIATASMNGKSFLHIPPHDRVFSTIPIPECYELDPEMIGKVDLSNSLLLIDEATLFWDARDFKTLPKAVREFFALHRHMRISVCMVTQTFNGLDKRIRDMCQYHYLLDKCPFFDNISLLKEIQHKQDVYNFKPDDRYMIVPMIQWKPVFRRHYYHLFDSYATLREYQSFDPVVYDGLNDRLRRNRKSIFCKLETLLPRCGAGAAGSSKSKISLKK